MYMSLARCYSVPYINSNKRYKFSLEGMACFCVQINNEVNIVETEQDNIEMSMRINTDIESEDTFYTDLNGFQVTRIRGKETIFGGNVCSLR
jgi:hypothetical protein